MNSASLTNLPKGHKFSGSGGILALICFFLPWILVSCGGTGISFSGLDLAIGKSIDLGFGSAERLPGKPLLLLVLLAALGALFLTYQYTKRNYLTIFDGIGNMALGAVALIVMLITFAGSGEGTTAGIDVSYRIGLWGTIIGFILVILGGYFNMKQATQVVGPAPTPPQPQV